MYHFLLLHMCNFVWAWMVVELEAILWRLESMHWMLLIFTLWFFMDRIWIFLHADCIVVSSRVFNLSFSSSIMLLFYLTVFLNIIYLYTHLESCTLYIFISDDWIHICKYSFHIIHYIAYIVLLLYIHSFKNVSNVMNHIKEGLGWKGVGDFSEPIGAVCVKEHAHRNHN